MRWLMVMLGIGMLGVIGGCGGGGEMAATPEKPTVTLTVDSTLFTVGSSVTLTWVSRNADTVLDADFDARGTTGVLRVFPLATRTYTITVGGPGGEATASVDVTLDNTPTVTLVTDPASVLYGDVATLYWTSERASAVVASNFSETRLHGDKRVAPTQTTTYTMTVRNEQGQEATGTCTLTVSPVTVAVAPAHAAVSIGGSCAFAATVTGAVSSQVLWDVVEPDGGDITTEGCYTAPATPGTYHIRARSALNADADAVATVVVQAGNAEVIIE